MTKTRFIVAGNFIDGSGTEVRRHVFLAVKGGIITAIGSAADLHQCDRTAIDDFSHCTIMPPLVDCSVFLSQSPSVNRDVRLAAEHADSTEKAVLLTKHISYCHAHGVLGVAANHDFSDMVKWYQEKTSPTGMLDIRTSCCFGLNRQDFTTGSPADSDFLKIYYSTNVEDEEAHYPQLSQEDLHRILQNRGKEKRWWWPMAGARYRRRLRPGAMPSNRDTVWAKTISGTWQRRMCCGFPTS